MEQIMDLLKLTGICPILVSATPEDAVCAARALVEGGLPVMEVLLKNEASVQNMAKIAREVPELYVGMGTVRKLDEAKRAIDLGAKFIVMPGFSKAVVDECVRRGVMVLPGCVTATEIMMAMDCGIHVVKFFPVFEMGGTSTLLQFYHGPFPEVRFVVTGALNSENFLPLLEAPNVLAAGGDWMFADEQALARRDFAQISRNMRNSVCRVQDMRNRKQFQLDRR